MQMKQFYYNTINNNGYIDTIMCCNIDKLNPIHEHFIQSVIFYVGTLHLKLNVKSLVLMFEIKADL